jgi:general stress protein 26
MRIETQVDPAFSRVCGLIENIPAAMLTNVTEDGTLVSRPMSPIEIDSSGALWFFIDLRHAKLEHLGAANLGFADPEHATFVSLSGRGQIHVDRARIAHLWTARMRPWFPDGPDSEHLALLKFVPDSAEYWDAPHSRMMRMFALAASVIAGKPIAMGEHDVLPARARNFPAPAHG